VELPGDGLRVEGVSFAVREKAILRDVSLLALPGKTTALLGPSGCGKTTLLRVVAGLERPDRGSVWFDGEDVTGVAAHRRGFGMMFQEFALFPHLDVQGNVAFGLRHQGLTGRRRRARVTELMELVGLSGYERRRVETLSGGERQRVALARALAPQPRLLMLDEPLGSLDRSLRERLLVELRGILRRLNVPTLYVTHDQMEAFALADRVAIMDDGRIVREGTPAEIHGEPRTEFVARFLGMENLVPGTCDGGRLRTAVGEWCGIAAHNGPVLALLRTEDAELVPAPGEGVVTGELVSRLFQGTRTRVSVQTAAGRLEFELPGSAELPPEGETLHVQVPHVQVVEGAVAAADG
jgi:ABC-type Fe3+/spermidine/putrescine transport system ATPase subunit